MAREGLGFARFILVLSSLSPVFLLWALRGVKAIDDVVWVPICLACFAIPNLFLWFFMRRARKVHNSKTITVFSARDQREHLLVYLFAMLIPLYDVNLDGHRALAALVLAFLFVVFIFWHLNLHYMNIFLAMRGYQIFTVETAAGASSGTEKPSETATYAFITKKHSLASGKSISGLRLGGSVLLDVSENDRTRI